MCILRNQRYWMVLKFRSARALIFGWIWVFDGRDWLLELCYLFWRIIERIEIIFGSQVRSGPFLGYFSGFMPEGRGLHWDRKSRYGIK